MLIPQTLSDPTDTDANISTDSHQTPAVSYLDTFYNSFDIDAATEEKHAADAMAGRAYTEMVAAESRMREAQRRAALAQAAIDGFKVWREASGQTDQSAETPDQSAETPAADTAAAGPDTVAPANGGATGGPASPTGRASIFSLIDSGAEDVEWTIPSLAETLGVGPESHHAIGVSLQRLTRDGKIARIRKGVYTKLPSEPDGPGAEEGREMRLNSSQEGPG